MGRTNQGWEAQKVNPLVQPGEGEWQEGVCRCSFSVLLSAPLAAASARLTLWELAQSFNDGRREAQRSWLSGALCL